MLMMEYKCTFLFFFISKIKKEDKTVVSNKSSN